MHNGRCSETRRGRASFLGMRRSKLICKRCYLETVMDERQWATCCLAAKGPNFLGLSWPLAPARYRVSGFSRYVLGEVKYRGVISKLLYSEAAQPSATPFDVKITSSARSFSRHGAAHGRLFPNQIGRTHFDISNHSCQVPVGQHCSVASFCHAVPVAKKACKRGLPSEQPSRHTQR